MQKKHMLYGIIIICILLAITAFAVSYNNLKVTPDKIHEATIKLNKLISENRYPQALTAYDKLIKMNSKLYSETSYDVAKLYLKKAEFALTIGLYETAKKSIDKAVKISENDAVSEQLKNDIFYTLYNYNFSTNMYHENLKLIESAEKDKVFMYEKPNVENFYGIIYLSLKNIPKAEKHFNNFKNITEDKKQLLQYYQNMTYLSQDKNDYNMYLFYLNKAKDTVNKYMPYDKNQKLRNFMAEITYYTDFARYDEALELLNKNFEYYTKDKGLNNKQEFYSTYFNIYKEKNDYEKAEEYLTKLEEFQKNYPKNSFLHLDIINNKIDLYGKTKNDKELFAELEKALTIIESVKDYVPAFYGAELKKAAEIKKEHENIEESYELIKTALDIYTKTFPESSYPMYEIYKAYADIISSKGNDNEALEYYQKSLEIINNLKGGISIDSADLYENIANIYSAQGNKNQAIEYINKAINIYSKTYGKDNIKTYEKMLTKCTILNNFSENKEAEKLLSYMKKNFSEKKTVGYKKDVYEQLQ